MSWKALFPRKVVDDGDSTQIEHRLSEREPLFSLFRLYLASNALPTPPLIAMVGGLDIQEVNF